MKPPRLEEKLTVINERVARRSLVVVVVGVAAAPGMMMDHNERQREQRSRMPLSSHTRFVCIPIRSKTARFVCFAHFGRVKRNYELFSYLFLHCWFLVGQDFFFVRMHPLFSNGRCSEVLNSVTVFE